MKITDSMTIELTLIDECDTEDIKGIKRLDERCNDVCQMLCDEGVQAGTTVIYNIKEAHRTVDI